MEGPVSPSEPTSRFITQKKWIKSSTNTVRHNAFMPNKDGEVSIYRTNGLDEPQIYDIGQRYMAGILGKPLIGRAEIFVSDIMKHGLVVDIAPIPHPRHANITNWSQDKLKNRATAMELASDANLFRVNNE